MSRGSVYYIFIMGFFFLIMFSGCAGTTKLMSEDLTSQYKSDSIPPSRNISIRMLEPIVPLDNYSDFSQKTFPKILSNKITKNHLYSEVNIITSNDNIATPLLMEIAIANVNLGIKKRDVGYVSIGKKGQFSIAGRIVDVNREEILVHWTASRVSDRDTIPLTSGLFWEGIAITNDENFLKNLMEWVAEDTVDFIKTLKVGGK